MTDVAHALARAEATVAHLRAELQAMSDKINFDLRNKLEDLGVRFPVSTPREWKRQGADWDGKPTDALGFDAVPVVYNSTILDAAIAALGKTAQQIREETPTDAIPANDEIGTGSPSSVDGVHS